ncbi:hypothetical protein [Allobranchiibius sp. CTAmp26]|uniref:hypothetical protein n=1 Tax=Allobranchiibius sp. CTAmp26 TaxID=2815214 RepID=UPI001AA1712C|nr:hypothetical protein [Allobranchiibius sp. CTAmp26]MBO1755226.1 hypothetical protein [Allobranchiibius sp. CTAmp26]
MKHARTTSAVAIGSAALILLLGACGSSAPSVTPPTGNVASSSSAPVTPTAPSTPTTVPPSTDSSTSATNASGTCTTSSTGIGPTPGASTPVRSYGVTAPITTTATQVEVGIKVEAPRKVSAGSIPPTAGTQLVAVQITATLEKGTSDYVGSTTFNMLDTSGNQCRKSYLNGLSSTEVWIGASLSATKKSATGSLVYEVPVSQDLSKLVVAYNGQFSTTATVQWRG